MVERETGILLTRRTGILLKHQNGAYGKRDPNRSSDTSQSEVQQDDSESRHMP